MFTFQLHVYFFVTLLLACAIIANTREIRDISYWGDFVINRSLSTKCRGLRLAESSIALIIQIRYLCII